MSRLKRQRLDVDGKHRVTATSDDDVADPSRPSATSQHPGSQQSKAHCRRSLFVHSLPASATTESLTAFFSQSFPIKHATVVVDPATKTPKGYGFVTFADTDDAQNAKESLHQALFDGRKIKVEIAEPRQRHGAKYGSPDAIAKAIKIERRAPAVQQPSKLIVRNLPWLIKDSDQLAALFRSYGKIKHATMPKKKPGLSAGFGFVTLRGKKNAERALEAVNGKEIGGRVLAVDWAVEKDVWESLQEGSQELEAEGQTTSSSIEYLEDKLTNAEEIGGSQQVEMSESDMDISDSDGSVGVFRNGRDIDGKVTKTRSDDHSSTLFVRNLPFTCTDEDLQDHFRVFGGVRYGRVVLDPTINRSKGTGFVSFLKPEDAMSCLREAPRSQPLLGVSQLHPKASTTKQSLLEDTSNDLSGHYTMDGRLLQISRAVDRNEAARLSYVGKGLRETEDRDKRRLYLLSEGTVPSDSQLYSMLSATEIKMREDSARQRQSLIRSNPTLHLSLTRLSIRNLPRSVGSKHLKALAREAVVGFAKDVKSGLREQLSKEELSRGSEESKEAEKARKAKGKGIVKQAKVVYEGRDGGKVAEESGAGRSRGYGFIEFTSHRWALMGLRWLNGRAVSPAKGTTTELDAHERKKRLITEFAIENAQVVGRRRDREAKARERSKTVLEHRQGSGLLKSKSKTLSRDQQMAKTRKGMNAKRISPADNARQGKIATTPRTSQESERTSRKQQIIGRKRMLRRLRK